MRPIALIGDSSLTNGKKKRQATIMVSTTSKEMLVYKVYRALSYALSSLLQLHLHWRKFCGPEHPTPWPERLGCASLRRPPGPLIWFHAVSLGEGMAAILLSKRCVEERPDLNILMTIANMSAFRRVKGLDVL